jgi:uncharacterized protein YndB with AHSA1/START domain
MPAAGPVPDPRDQDAGVVRYDRVLGHPRERVWEALTNPEDVRQWMAAERVVLEGRVGGRFELQGIVNGQGRVLAWDPPRLLEHEFHLVTPTGGKDGGVVTYELRAAGTDTHLTMTFRSLSPALARLFVQGRIVTFDRLEAVLAGRTPPPFGRPGARS